MNEAILKALGENKELHVMKGLFQSPGRHVKTTGEIYYSFDLKTLKQYGADDEYGQTYNMYNCIIPSDMAMNFTDDDIKAFKDCEVIVICSTRCSIKRGDKVKYNNISFYVQDIESSRKVTMRPGGTVPATPRSQAL